MTPAKTAAIAKAVATVIREHVRPLRERIEALEHQQKALCYCGTWEPAHKYEKGNFVTDGGSVWHCNRETTQRPGPGDAWTLAVKRGADAR